MWPLLPVTIIDPEQHYYDIWSTFPKMGPEERSLVKYGFSTDVAQVVLAFGVSINFGECIVEFMLHLAIQVVEVGNELTPNFCHFVGVSEWLFDHASIIIDHA